MNNTSSEISSEEYDSSHIKIKDNATHYWEAAVSLSEQYNKNEKWVAHGLEACELAHIPYSYFIDRYLKKLDAPQNFEVSEIFKSLLKNA